MSTRGSSLGPSASVVIPTCNRVRTLTSVLEELARQVAGSALPVEVVVVDDGSADGTWAALRAWKRRLPLVTLRQENAGPARARNRGTAAASGDIVLFLGDDTVPQPGWLEVHLEEHRIHHAEPLAVVGYTSFAAVRDTPFLRWINEFGDQFGYLLIERGDHLPFNFFYTSNVSLPRRLLVELGGFREDFPAAAWEDTELAYRAVAIGMRLLYQPLARVQHRHRILPRTFRRRQRTAGRCAAIFAALHPELEGFLGVPEADSPSLRRAVRERFLGTLVVLGEQLPGGIPGEIYRRYLRSAYLAGLAEGLQGRERR